MHVLLISLGEVDGRETRRERELGRGGKKEGREIIQYKLMMGNYISASQFQGHNELRMDRKFIDDGRANKR